MLNLVPVASFLLPPFQPVTTAEVWHLRCRGSEDLRSAMFFFDQTGFPCFFNVVTMYSLYKYIYICILYPVNIAVKRTMLQEKRENGRQTWTIRRHLYNILLFIRTSSGCLEKCWFQPIPHLHLPLESDVWMNAPMSTKHFFSVHLKPSWWINGKYIHLVCKR